MPTDWTDADPAQHLAAVTPLKRRRDAETLLAMMREVTGVEPRMFGRSIIGFGQYNYRYDSGHSGFAPAAGFAARKSACVIYLADGLSSHRADLDALGPHREGVGCLYLSDLSQLQLDVLRRIIARSFATLQNAEHTQRARDT